MSARSDDNGVFRFAEVPPGEYDGRVEPGQHHPHYLFQPLVTGPGRYAPIVVKGGDAREVNVALRRTRAIAVRVVDEWGEPVSGVNVVTREAGTPRQVGDPRAQTDDRGRLRVFGIAPGRYTLCAEIGTVGLPAGGRGREGLLTTCYPSATDDRAAQVVTVGREDVGELEIRMRRGVKYTVSGRVLDAAGVPVTNTFIGLSKFTANGGGSQTVSLNAQGEFRIPNVVAGDYAIEAGLGGPERPQDRRPLERAFVPISVQDDMDLVVRLRRTVDVHGRVTLEDPAATLPTAPGSGLLVVSKLAEADTLPGLASAASALTRADRTFTLTGLHGARRIRVSNVPPGWYVKSILYRGKDVIDEAVEFQAVGDRPQLEVMVSNRGAAITGRVHDGLGRNVPRAAVLLFRDEAGRPELVASTRSFQDATYRLGPLRGGEFRLVALPPGQATPDRDDRERIAQLLKNAERVRLADLEERSVDLQSAAR